MATQWPPSREAELANYLVAFSAAISATPTAFGFTVPEAAALASAVTAFINALALAVDKATRTESAVADKEIKKATALAMLRVYAKRIQANPAVTVQQKVDLGLPIHKTTQTPIPAPATRPSLTVLTPPTGRTVTIRIKDETTPETKAKPFGVQGAEVYSYVPTGTEEPPADLEKWRFEGIAKRADFEVDFNPEDVGKRAYILAVWFNPRGEPGPAGTPVTATVVA